MLRVVIHEERKSVAKLQKPSSEWDTKFLLFRFLGAAALLAG